MRPLRSITVLTAAVLLAAPEALAQGPGAVAHTQVTVIVPERAPARDVRSTSSRSLEGASFTPSSGRASGRNDLDACTGTLELGAIGRASVSCIETAEPGRAGGVVLEIPATVAGDALPQLLDVQLRLDDGAVLRLIARPWVRDGRDVYRLAVPAIAVERAAASRVVSISAYGHEHVLRGNDLALLRRAAGLPVHRASRE